MNACSHTILFTWTFHTIPETNKCITTGVSDSDVHIKCSRNVKFSVPPPSLCLTWRRRRHWKLDIHIVENYQWLDIDLWIIDSIMMNKCTDWSEKKWHQQVFMLLHKFIQHTGKFMKHIDNFETFNKILNILIHFETFWNIWNILKSW